LSAFASEVKRFSQTLGLPRAVLAAVTRGLLRRVLPRGIVLPLPMPRTHTCLWARSKTSDASVYFEVFFSDNYLLDTMASPSLVVDAGANVGYTSALFSQTWPGARIVSIEPDESNYRQLQRNTRRCPNVEAHLGALWGEPASLRILDRNAKKSGIRVESTESDAGYVAAMTVADILRLTGQGKIDIFKVDIEGGELNLFTKDPSCLDHVGLLMIELHERYQPGSTEALHKALEGRRYDLKEHGNMTYVTFSEGGE
jgi:FkbM family methyltransferase